MNKLISFFSDISTINLPKVIDYPYNYEPHTIAKIAAQELQQYLKTQTDFQHDFGIKNPNSLTAMGKMFGVLVVKTEKGKLGYLAAFSGKLANKVQHKHFVPPVFDMLNENGFYKKIENELNSINHKIENLTIKNASQQKEYNSILVAHQNLWTIENEKIKLRQQQRRQTYKSIKNNLTDNKLKEYQEQINQLKLNENFYLREYQSYLDDKLNKQFSNFIQNETVIENLKKLRAEKSASVQQQIFEQYSFINTKGAAKNLVTIFSKTNQNIPAGAGDCCAPKLFQYAFKHGLTPIALAEFWWGKPLESSVRKHSYFYPACIGKCKPILTHMLKGLPVNPNPLFEELSNAKPIDFIYEDEYLAVIHKPHNLLSVAGTEIKDSVEVRMQNRYPKATGPLIVHRLDMSTSGIMLIAKTKEIHKALQEQFANKTIKKRYVAILNGKLTRKSGSIDLPLKVDFHHRPKQMVCLSNGKKALTNWELLSQKDTFSRVHFYPITGRTHQLRMHAAHPLGLNTAILGDELYGKRSKRLYLHAEFIEFMHPVLNKTLNFTAPCEF